MYLITSYDLTKLKNSEILAFHLNVQKAITEAGVSKLGLDSSLNTAYGDAIKRLNDQVYNNLGSEETALMQKYDAQRDQIYRRIHLRLQMVDYSDDHAALKSCRETVDKILLAKYSGSVTSMPQQEETAVIKGFLLDCASNLSDDDKEALGIESDLNALETANTSFMEAYNARAAKRADSLLAQTTKLRADATEQYELIAIDLQYTANKVIDSSSSSASTDQEKAAACQTLIGVINVIVNDTKNRYNARIGGLSEEVSEDESVEKSE